MRRILTDHPFGSRTIDPKIPEDLENIVLRSIAKDASDRYQSAADLARDLDDFVERRRSDPEPLAAKASGARSRRLALLLAVSTVLTVAAIFAARSLFSPSIEGPIGKHREAGRGTSASRDGDIQPAARAVDNPAAELSPFAGAGSEVQLPVGEAPQDVTAADIDGNGHLDLITADALSATVSVLFNRGDRLFEVAVQYPVGGGGAMRVLACDLSGDDSVDLVCVTPLSKMLRILVNDGKGNFSNGPELPLTGPVFDAVVADLDRDGKEDLAATGGRGYIWVLRREGPLRFARALSYESVLGPEDLHAADLDGDGAIDLVSTCVHDAPSHVAVHRNDGKGAFSTLKVPSPRANDVIATDLDGNGAPELIGPVALNRTRAPTDRIWILESRGDGDFEPAKTISFPGRAESIAAADLDGDGDADLVAAGGENEVVILRNDGNGGLTKRLIVTHGAGPTDLAVVDLDGDGRPDLAVSNGRSHDVTVLYSRVPGPAAR